MSYRAFTDVESTRLLKLQNVIPRGSFHVQNGQEKGRLVC